MPGGKSNRPAKMGSEAGEGAGDGLPPHIFIETLARQECHRIMQRLIAVRTPQGTYDKRGTYNCSVITFASDRTKGILDTQYATSYAAHVLVSGGNLLTIDNGPIRPFNNAPCVHEQSLVDVMQRATENNIHHISFFDRGQALLKEIGDWNMTCTIEETGDDLFIENIATAHRWYHLLDAHAAFRQMTVSHAV